MDIKKIEHLYENSKFAELTEMVDNIEEMSDNTHILRLIVRACSKEGISFVKKFGSFPALADDIDFRWNLYLFNESDAPGDEEMLRTILHEGRDDLLDDYILLYMDSHGEMPVFESLTGYLADNINKPAVKKYLAAVYDDADFPLRVIADYSEGRAISQATRAMTDSTDIPDAAFELFLSDGINSEQFALFTDALRFTEGCFIIYDSSIYKIKGYNALKKKFILLDKMKREKEINMMKVLEQTTPIGQNDFRVYKYFNPDGAKNLSPCELLISILKYSGGSIDKKRLEKELMYIHGADARQFIKKHSSRFEQCPGVHIIFGKTDRYMLTDEDEDQILSHVRRLKDPGKIRDYIMEVLAKTGMEESVRESIREFARSIKSPVKEEILYLLSGDTAYIENASQYDVGLFRNEDFIKRLILLKAVSDSDYQLPGEIDHRQIEYIYKNSDSVTKDKILSKASDGLRIGKDLDYLKWYLNFHIDDNLLPFPQKHIYIKAMEIAGTLGMKKRSDPFLNFVRKFLFSKSSRFLKLMETTDKAEFRQLFDAFMKSGLLNDYRKDEIRKAVYGKYPDFREIAKIEYLYSTKESIARKQSELREITDVILPELSAKIKEAASHGDLSENAEYKSSREQYVFFSSRAEEMQKDLSMVQPIDFESVKTDRAGIGTRVMLENVNTGKIKHFTILGPFDADSDKGIISYLSPLAKELEGKTAGDIVKDMKIKAIEKAEG